MPNFSRKFIILIICCLGVIIYSNSFSSSFHFDDELSIVSNLSIRDLFNLKGIWNFWPTRFITYLSVAFNYYFNQLNVFGFHLFNLTVHLSNTLLVWWLISLTFLTPAIKQQEISKYSKNIAFFASLIFLTHPIQTQTVTYIIQRATSLAAFFYLLSLGFYIKSRILQEDKGSKFSCWFYYIASILACICSMFTKEFAITLPFSIILYEFFFIKEEKRINWKYVFPFLMCLLVIPSVMFFTKSVNFVEMRLVTEPSPGISWWHYLLTQTKVLVTYLRLLILPINQNIDYDYPISKSIFEFGVGISLIFLSVLLFLAARLFSKYRLLAFSIFWFFLTLLPESGVIPIKDVIFEHRLYLPMVGFAIFIVAIIHYFLANKNTKIMVILLSAIVLLYSTFTYSRNYFWKDEIVLWNDVIRKSPKKARAYSERGNAYVNKGLYDRAILDFNKAIELDPFYANAYNNRGIVFLKKEMLDRAVFDFSEAIKNNSRSAFFYYNRANAYRVKGALDAAFKDYTSAIHINKNFSLAYHNRGAIYFELGRFDLAISDYSQALKIEPNLALTLYNRGNTYKAIGKLDEAILDYSQALKIEPNLAGAYRNRAQAYFLKGQYHNAWIDVRKVKELGFEVDAKFMEELKRH